MDGNEKKGQARLRVGNAVIHDAWSDATPYTTPGEGRGELGCSGLPLS